ncbi:protein tyrosine phosphatase receptor type C-associated protein [Pogona vitticeps]
MKLRFAQALSAQLLLFSGKCTASISQKGGGSGNRSDNVIVGILVFTLLLLLLLLFLAWRHLSYASEGTYHPWRLMRGLIIRLQNLWVQIRSEALSQEDPDEKQSDEDLGEQQEDDTENEEQEQGEELLPQQADNESEEEEERQEMLDERAELEPTEKEAAQEPLKEEEPSGAVEGKAGVLLSDLHSFSGTAAWEDSSKQAQATAL